MVAAGALCDDETDMSGTETTPQHTAAHPAGGRPGERPARRAFRAPERGYLGGVAAGLADHLGVDAFVVRALFLLTSVFGFGVLFYAGLWLTLPMEPATASSPGLDAATR